MSWASRLQGTSSQNRPLNSTVSGVIDVIDVAAGGDGLVVGVALYPGSLCLGQAQK